MAVNVQVKPGEEHNRYELLAWLNESLQTRFTKVEQTCSGAAFCQLMHWLFPGSVDLQRVRFQASDEVDALHNYSVLQSGFRRSGVIKSIPVEGLIGGSSEVSLDFLLWFKVFFDSNHNGQEYDALEARAGQSMPPANAAKQPQRPKALTQLNFCETQLHALSALFLRFFGQEKALGVQTAEPEEKEDTFFPFSPSLLRLIQKHWPSPEKHGAELTQDQVARHVLGQKYPQDITAACSQTPYCLYLYRGVELGGDGDRETASVLLMGYFDQGSGVKHVRLLDTLQPRDATVSAGTAELNCLVETLRRFELPLANLAVFYCGDSGLSQMLVTGLRALNPGLVSLCGLPGLAGRACHVGVTALQEPVLDLVRDIHHHYSTCPTTNDNLKEIFADVAPLDPLLPLSSQCLFLGRTVQRMADAWPELLQYFESRGSEGDAEQVCALLRDIKVRLSLLFLGQALEPLCAFQELLEWGDSDVANILQQASSLVHSYAASFLRSPAVDRFLRRREPTLLANEKDHLLRVEVNTGARVKDFLSEHQAELKHDVVDSFLESSVSFYKATTWSLMESLPLPNVALKNIPILLRPAGRLEVTGKVVAELGSLMGLCGVPGDMALLTDEFLDYMISEGEKPTADSPSPEPTVEQHWKQVLRTMGKTSILRRLIRSLLTLPSGSLQRDKVFAQAIVLGDGSKDEDYWLTEETEHSEDEGIPSSPSSPLKQESSSSGKIVLHIYRNDEKGYNVGDLVWGQIEGYSLWPGIVQPWKGRQAAKSIRKVEWDIMFLLFSINTQGLLQFGAFAQFFCTNSFATLVTYRDAIFQSLQVAALRCRKVFSLGSDEREEHLRVMLDWAFGGFKPTGPDGFQPPLQTEGASSNKGENDQNPDFQPPLKKQKQQYNKKKDPGYVYEQPDQKYRAFCLCCMADDTEIFHPLFEGSLCLKCKDNFTETLYRYDEDGYQSYCTVCCAGLEVILCGNDSCCRSYCVDCLNILVGPGTFDSLKEVDPWICYLCEPHHGNGALKPRLDWSIRVQEFFANNSAFQFEPDRVYPSIPANLRRPINVLSLFDGIGTGYLVLKELGFKVDKYVASEICSESIAVSEINHEGKILHVDDVRLITKEHILKWGPFDLLIGGSPCNDLSIVNPARKGLFEGTGRLFFEYYRLLHIMKPKEDDRRPFFWFFENVVFMNNHHKVDICRFLECNPVLVDAVKVSPAHRARYFWGNIPGMNRPITASQNDKVILQDCLERGRVAKFTKVRTITTNSNSLKQGKDVSKLPVSEKGVDDNLWITELEKIFGFPKHYTDVKNMNRQQRQKVLGKSWSVPVIRHLFAPLKDYFACEQLPPFPSQPTSSSATAVGEGSMGGPSWCSPLE
uniref:DNA (cytosine-5-)-methyltransferase n=1 Tax=Hucho hucho TaxID=62062 RepID=A0A4W5M1D2_9TELE